MATRIVIRNAAVEKEKARQKVARLRELLPDLRDAHTNWNVHTVEARDAVLRMMLWVLIVLISSKVSEDEN